MARWASRYDENTNARAVQLVREHGSDYDSEWAAMKAISARLGMSAKTLRKWMRQAEVDAGQAVVETRHRARIASVSRSAACAITPTSVSPRFDAANSVSVLMISCASVNSR
jgi:transposase-like protein